MRQEAPEVEDEASRARAEEDARRLAVLQDVPAAIAQADGAAAVARFVVERVRVAARALGTVFWVLEGDTLRLLDEAGARVVRERFEVMPLSAPLPAAEAVRRRAPLWLHSAAELRAQFPAAAELVEPIGVQSGAAVPLLGRGGALGVFALVFAEPRAFGRDDRAFLISVAEQCAQALERVRLLDAERALRSAAQRARDRLARLQGVTAALSRASTTSEVAEVLVAQAKETLGADSAVALMTDPSGAHLVLGAVRGWAEGVRERIATVPLDAPIPVATAARSGEPIWLEGAAELAAAFPRLGEFAPHLRELRAVAALPLTLGGRVLGAVSFGFETPRAFDAEQRELILAAAQQCAQALDRARLLDAEREARAAEARSRALLDAIFDHAPIGIGVIDRDLRFVRVNPRLAEINGVPAEAHAGRTPRELLPELPHDLVEATFREILRTGQPQVDVAISGETPAAPGRRRHWLESWYPIRVEGEPIGIGVLVREVTAEREAEEFQRNVLGIVGHDLRNPLSAIDATTRLLVRHAAGDAPALRLGERILANAGRMERIIAVLVDYARVRGGARIPLRRTDCDLGALCRTVAEELEAAHPGRRVRASGAPGLRGECDPDRVAQVLANLVSNALDYSPAGSPVELAWRAEGERAEVTVANEGSPIPPDLLPTLFDPFRRGERERAGGKDGLGLGLFIARSIASAHGGTLEVRSAPGERTVFTLRLPLR